MFKKKTKEKPCVRRMKLSLRVAVDSLSFTWRAIVENRIKGSRDDVKVQRMIWNRLRYLERRRDKLAHYIKQLS